MATVKLARGKPTVTIEGLSYKAAQAVKVWLYYSIGGSSAVRSELDALEEQLRDIRTPGTLKELGIYWSAITSDHPLADDDGHDPF